MFDVKLAEANEGQLTHSTYRSPFIFDYRRMIEHESNPLILTIVSQLASNTLDKNWLVLS